jgi:hypothetical protein
VTTRHLSAGGLVAFECRGFDAVGGLSVIGACSTSFVRFDARPRPVVGTRLASNTGRISVRTRIRFGKIGGATGLRRSGPRRSDMSHGHSASANSTTCYPAAFLVQYTRPRTEASRRGSSQTSIES